MSYIPFARKYRPQSFDELVGQRHIATTLKNAVLQNRIANAYLFAGPHGTGKTSTARIFAKVLNCEKGQTISPCNKCVSCNEITQGASLDVLEIDGASNRGIDEARTIRENVRFAPSRGRFKIYIIDEVHMLTQEAFNALLKTLEEPPGHVKFFFATTAPHKVIPTILSRCQRFDFKRIATGAIVERLKIISEKEKIEIEEGALFIIARASDGSLRDAESLLDQIASFSKAKVTERDTREILGIIDKEIVYELADYIIHKNAKDLLKKVDEMIQAGVDIIQLCSALMEHFRNLIICKFEKSAAGLIEMPEDYIARLNAQANQMTQEDGLYIFQTLSNAQDAIRRLSSGRIQLEVALIKLIRRADIVPLENIIDKLSEIEKRLVAQDIPQAQNLPPRIYPKGFSIDEIRQIWSALIDVVGKEKISISSYLAEGQPMRFEDERLIIAIPNEFTLHKEMLEEPQNRIMIEKKLAELLNGKGISIKFVTTDMPAKNISNENTKHPAKRNLSPMVESALKIFDAKITHDPYRATD